MPSAVQATFSILCLVILPFIPESTRWLAYKNRLDDTLAAVAQTYANGDAQHPIVLVVFKETTDTIEYEKDVGETLSLRQMVKTPVARKGVTQWSQLLGRRLEPMGRPRQAFPPSPRYKPMWLR
jgi:hypothetical protein